MRRAILSLCAPAAVALAVAGCGGGSGGGQAAPKPPAGTWWPDYALGLAQRARW